MFGKRWRWETQSETLSVLEDLWLAPVFILFLSFICVSSSAVERRPGEKVGKKLKGSWFSPYRGKNRHSKTSYWGEVSHRKVLGAPLFGRRCPAVSPKVLAEGWEGVGSSALHGELWGAPLPAREAPPATVG